MLGTAAAASVYLAPTASVQPYAWAPWARTGPFYALRPALLQTPITKAHRQTRLRNTLPGQGISSEDKSGLFELSLVLTILELQSRQLLPEEIHNLFSIKNDRAYQMREFSVFTQDSDLFRILPFSDLHVCISSAKLETHSSILQEMAQ